MHPGLTNTLNFRMWHNCAPIHEEERRYTAFAASGLASSFPPPGVVDCLLLSCFCSSFHLVSSSLSRYVIATIYLGSMQVYPVRGHCVVTNPPSLRLNSPLPGPASYLQVTLPTLSSSYPHLTRRLPILGRCRLMQHRNTIVSACRATARVRRWVGSGYPSSRNREKGERLFRSPLPAPKSSSVQLRFPHLCSSTRNPPFWQVCNL